MSIKSIYNWAIVWGIVPILGRLNKPVYQVKAKCLFWERVQAFALVNTKPTCDWASVGQTAEGVNKAN